MSVSITELMLQAKPRGLTVQNFFPLSVPNIVFAVGYLMGTYFQFLPLPLDVASLWNMVEVIPLCYEEVGQLGTGYTF